MDDKALLISLGELQGLKIEPQRAARMTEPGGVWDMVRIIRSILFQMDLTGVRPSEDLRFGNKGEKP